MFITKGNEKKTKNNYIFDEQIKFLKFTMFILKKVYKVLQYYFIGNPKQLSYFDYRFKSGVELFYFVEFNFLSVSQRSWLIRIPWYYNYYIITYHNMK